MLEKVLHRKLFMLTPRYDVSQPINGKRVRIQCANGERDTSSHCPFIFTLPFKKLAKYTTLEGHSKQTRKFLSMVHSNQYYRGLELCPLTCILKRREQTVSATGSVFVIEWRERQLASRFGLLQWGNLNHWTTYVKSNSSCSTTYGQSASLSW
jgi:hypothetical protein